MKTNALNKKTLRRPLFSKVRFPAVLAGWALLFILLPGRVQAELNIPDPILKLQVNALEVSEQEIEHDTSWIMWSALALLPIAGFIVLAYTRKVTYGLDESPPRYRLLQAWRFWVSLLLTGVFALCLTMMWLGYQRYRESPIYWEVTGLGQHQAQLLVNRAEQVSSKSTSLGMWSNTWRQRSPKPHADLQYTLVVWDPKNRELFRDKFSVSEGKKINLSINIGGTVERPLNLVAIEPGRFNMGSPVNQEGYRENETLHSVTLTRPFYLGRTEVTQAEFLAVMNRNPSEYVSGSGKAPVESVTWNEAMEFCRRLTDQERFRLPPDYIYRLPTEAEWEMACRAGTETPYFFGDTLTPEQARFGLNKLTASPDVRDFPANAWGLYDMHGNVWEWCYDGFFDYPEEPTVNPIRSTNTPYRVYRGGSRNFPARYCRSAHRDKGMVTDRYHDLGFRVAVGPVLDVSKAPPDEPSKELPETPPETTAPPPENTATYPPHLVRIPPGRFLRGSPENEAGRYDDETQHLVAITYEYAIAKTEVTQGEYAEIMGDRPSFFQLAGEDAPVESVSWSNAMDYCSRLTELHREQGLLGTGYVYRLPTEAEWEYACRAKTAGPVYQGTWDILGLNHAPALDPIAWYGGNSAVSYLGGIDASDWPETQFDHDRAGVQRVGQKIPNAWGLYDMLGNAYEWCFDHYLDYPQQAVTNPVALLTGPADRLVRGGGWNDGARFCRAAYRGRSEPGTKNLTLGFRVVAVPRKVKYTKLTRR